MARTLIAYFSASGETARLAKTLAGVTGGTLFAITPAQPYTAADLNWQDSRSRTSRERDCPGIRPALAATVPDWGTYDTVFLGFPIWWYTAPCIVHSFLEQHPCAGKRVIPFATSGGSGLGQTEAHLRQTAGAGVEWLPGRRLSSRESAAALARWVKELGL